jgi:putative drug exporter of the RND superfamily
MSRVVDMIVGRRSKWVIGLAWLVVVAVAGLGATRFGQAQQNAPRAYEPRNAESSVELALSDRISGGQQVTPAVVVFARSGGLHAADLRTVEDDRRRLNAELPRAGVPAPPGLRSNDGQATLLIFGLRLHDSNPALASEVGLIRRVVHVAPAGLEAKVAGPAGSAYDANQIFGEINGTLLLVTVSLIFVLLVLIYRSPIFWVIPLIAVGFAEITAEGVGYLLTRIGVTVTGESAAILTVLVFGAGTDYALLLVSRYHEELHRVRDRSDAMRLALGRAAPTILASGSTVILALLCLLAAEVNGTRGLGPIAAIGVIIAMLSGLTLLPALLLVAGRRAFWPYIPHFRDDATAATKPGVWHRIASALNDRPRPIALLTTAALIVMCLGLSTLNTGLTSGGAFSHDVESDQGQTILAEHFPAGRSEPVEVVVTDPHRVEAVRVAVGLAPGVAGGPLAVGPVTSRAGDAVFDVTLAADPASQRAFDLVAGLRRVAKQTAGAAALIGGPTADEVDLRAAASRDTNLIVPLILIVVFLILAVLLRALVAPALLIGTVVLSYGAALGTGALVFRHVFGYPGEDPSLELFSFLFLVALGVDYNIFLMARVREETLVRGTRVGAVRALEVTGPVISSAGIVLAGTFSALASLPLVGFTELGFVIAFGVLLDTFLVRTVLVPALVIEFDRRIWWPSRLARRASPVRGARKSPTPTRRRLLLPGLIGAAALIGGLGAGVIASAKPSGRQPASARSGPITLAYAAPWRETAATAPGSFALAAASPGSPSSAPVLLGSGRASLAAGRLAASAPIPGGPPPALGRRYGRPVGSATIELDGLRVRRYTWRLHDDRVLVARIVPTSGSDLAVLCSAADGDRAALQSCAGIAAGARVSGVAPMPPGADALVAAGLADALGPLAAVRARLGALSAAEGAGLARAATRTAQLERGAVAVLAELPLPGRNRAAVQALEAELRSEAAGLGAIASAVGRDPGRFAEDRERVILASARLGAAVRALLAEGFKVAPLDTLGAASAPQPAPAARTPAVPPRRPRRPAGAAAGTAPSTTIPIVGPI